MDVFFFFNYFLTQKNVSFAPFKPMFSADASAELGKGVDEQWRNVSVWYAVEHFLLVERI